MQLLHFRICETLSSVQNSSTSYTGWDQLCSVSPLWGEHSLCYGSWYLKKELSIFNKTLGENTQLPLNVKTLSYAANVMTDKFMTWWRHRVGLWILP